jgi:hypothetical protein
MGVMTRGGTTAPAVAAGAGAVAADTGVGCAGVGEVPEAPAAGTGADAGGGSGGDCEEPDAGAAEGVGGTAGSPAGGAIDARTLGWELGGRGGSPMDIAMEAAVCGMSDWRRACSSGPMPRGIWKPPAMCCPRADDAPARGDGAVPADGVGGGGPVCARPVLLPEAADALDGLPICAAWPGAAELTAEDRAVVPEAAVPPVIAERAVSGPSSLMGCRAAEVGSNTM